jgi:hypothetical protein
MASNIGERLLKDAENCRSQLSVYVNIPNFDYSFTIDSYPLLKFLRLPFDGCRKTKVIQYTRS